MLELADYLQNVSQTCRVMGVSRQHFYDIKQAVAEGGVEALREHTRRKPNLRNRAAPETEAAVQEIALAEPALGWGSRIARGCCTCGIVTMIRARARLRSRIRLGSLVG